MRVTASDTDGTEFFFFAFMIFQRPHHFLLVAQHPFHWFTRFLSFSTSFFCRFPLLLPPSHVLSVCVWLVTKKGKAFVQELSSFSRTNVEEEEEEEEAE